MLEFVQKNFAISDDQFILENEANSRQSASIKNQSKCSYLTIESNARDVQ